MRTANNGNGAEKQKHQYSFLSMLAIIIGTVIGSGIYVKNSSLIETTESGLLSIIGWIIGGLIVVAILIAFLEVSSITKIKKEQGTLTAFSKYLLSPKLTKLISGYFVFIYFPFIIAAESIFAANQLFLGIDDGLSSIADGWGWLIITSLAIISIIIITYIVIYFAKTTSVLQMSGTILKMIPLVLLIFIALFIITGISVGETSGGDYNHVFDPNDPINAGLSDPEGQSNIVKILLIIPPILFAFDGFLFANSLSSEAKSENTYKMSAISAIFIITLVYLLFSMSTFMLGDADGGLDSNNFTITAVFINIFGEDLGVIIGETISFIVFISIITAVFGYAVSSMWAVSDASNINEIKDVNGTLVRRINNGHPRNAAVTIMIVSISIVLILRIFDGIGLLLEEDEVTGIYVGMTDFITNISTLLNFTFYTIIIIGAFANRFTKRVEVEKTKLFYPAASFAIFSISLVILVMIYNIFYELANNPNLGLVILQIVMAACFFASIIILVWWNSRSVKNTTDDEWESKKPYQNAYRERLTYNEYLNLHEFMDPEEEERLSSTTNNRYLPVEIKKDTDFKNNNPPPDENTKKTSPEKNNSKK